MPAKSGKKPGWGDRVRKPDEAEATGTLIDTYKEGGFGVMPDAGPKQIKKWDEAIRVSGPIKTCPRCGSSDHLFQYCKENL